MNNIPYEAKSLRWLENMFPFNENATDNIDKMSNAIHVYCKAGADCIEANTKELERYRKLGTVEEIQRALDKANAKKCIEDSCPDHTHYKCPTCGKIQMSVYAHGCPRLGRIPHNCDNCGQRLEK